MPVTLTKIADFKGNLEKAAKKFNSKCEEMIDNLGVYSSLKYAVYDCSREPYLLIVSHQIIKENSKDDYDSILTITSDFDKKNQEVLKEFEEKSEIKYRDAPKRLEDLMNGLNLTFGVLKKHGEVAMGILLKKKKSQWY